MKQIVTFKSDLFNSTEPGSHFINDRCFGEDLVAWIIEKFPDNNYVLDEPFQEDWGWATLARRENEAFLISVGIMDEFIGKVPAEWMIIIEKTRRFMIFGSKKSPNLSVLADILQQVMKEEERVTDIVRTVEN